MSSVKTVSILPGIALLRPVDPRYAITARVGQVNKKLWATYHKGVDFACPMGVTVHSVMEGKVQMAGEADKLGARLWILSDHPEYGPIRHLYAHLNAFFVDVGDKIKSGQPIAYSGNTGNSTSPHLHFQIERWPSRDLISPEFHEEMA